MYTPDIVNLSGGAAAGALGSLKSEYMKYCEQNLKLDMQRGRPCTGQLDISSPMLDWGDAPYACADGNDARNYGGAIEGAPEARDLVAGLLDVKRENIIVWGNSSLSIMYDLIVKAMLFGVRGGEKGWLEQSREAGEKLKFICPSPGYDRHFLITETLGFELITVDMNNDGPDMEAIAQLVAGDPMVKGVWNIPKYHNPTGITYSDDVVRAFAALKPAAPDFRIFWDSAYMAHDLYDESDNLLNLLAEAEKCGNADMVYMFMSSSKITFAGAGITALAASADNIRFIGKQLAVQSICPDKINHLRHARFIKDADGLRTIMRKHAAIIRPKFELVNKILEEEFRSGGAGGQPADSCGVGAGTQSGNICGMHTGGSPGDICEWTNPRGGYFISLDAPDNCAKEALRLAAEAGVKFTTAGATFPYGADPRDRNIRIAPTVPDLDEIDKAIHILALCIKIAYLTKK